MVYPATVALARIQVMRGRTREQKQRLLRGVRSALVEAIGVPADDPTVALIEHDPEDVLAPPHVSSGYTIVEITMFAGRSMEAKRLMYGAIIRNVSACEVSPSDILIVVHEPTTENWAVNGGTPASEVDLGFQVDV